MAFIKKFLFKRSNKIKSKIGTDKLDYPKLAKKPCPHTSVEDKRTHNVFFVVVKIYAMSQKIPNEAGTSKGRDIESLSSELDSKRGRDIGQLFLNLFNI